VAIARAAGIHIWENHECARAYNNPYADQLCECISLDWAAGVQPGSFFAAEIFRGFAELVDSWARGDPGLLGYFGGDALTERSHGQCNMAFFANRFGIPGLYLLEHFVKTIKYECLNHFVIFGERHLRHLIKEFVEHYMTERFHQGIGGQLIKNVGPTNDNGADGKVVCRSRLGGLLNFYHREAA
jgi:hypothetical protein